MGFKNYFKVSEKELLTPNGADLFINRMWDKFILQNKKPKFDHYEMFQREVNIIMNVSPILRKFVFRFNFVCLESFLKNNKTPVTLTSYKEKNLKFEIGKILGRRVILKR